MSRWRRTTNIENKSLAFYQLVLFEILPITPFETIQTSHCMRIFYTRFSWQDATPTKKGTKHLPHFISLTMVSYHQERCYCEDLATLSEAKELITHSGGEKREARGEKRMQDSYSHFPFPTSRFPFPNWVIASLLRRSQ